MIDNIYRPIACALHESYQYAVMTRSLLDLGWKDDAGVSRRARVLPVDVVTREQAEFLVFKEKDGSQGTVRLDRVEEALLVRTGERLTG